MNCALTSESALNATEIETRHQIMLQGSSLVIAWFSSSSTLNTSDDLCKIVTFPYWIFALLDIFSRVPHDIQIRQFTERHGDAQEQATLYNLAKQIAAWRQR